MLRSNQLPPPKPTGWIRQWCHRTNLCGERKGISCHGDARKNTRRSRSLREGSRRMLWSTSGEQAGVSTRWCPSSRSESIHRLSRPRASRGEGCRCRVAPSSPDLTPLDFYLWGSAKKVAPSIPNTAEEMKRAIVRRRPCPTGTRVE